MTPQSKAHLLALIVPSALMAGALGFQFLGGLPPCEMCHWQRWPLYAAIALALLAFVLKGAQVRRALVALAALGILSSGGIGAFHAGVEYGWWEGLTQCSQPIGMGGGDFMKEIMNAPLIRCDTAPWSLFGISLAGFNAIISITSAFAIFSFLRKRGA